MSAEEPKPRTPVEKLEDIVTQELGIWALNYLALDRERPPSKTIQESETTLLETLPKKVGQELINQTIPLHMAIPGKTSLGDTKRKQFEKALSGVASILNDPLDMEELRRFRIFYSQIREIERQAAPKSNVTEIYSEDDLRRRLIREQRRVVQEAKFRKSTEIQSVADNSSTKKSPVISMR